jgi:NADH-quinone oxidoreductase subunit N
VATMVLGTTVGVAQGNVKRMLAYSSIAHGGYLLVGLIAANSVGKAGILFYLASYGITNVAAFGLMALLSTEDHPHDNVRDFAGLWQRRPVLAGLMTIFLLSLGGLPPTAGFVAKWYVFAAAVQEGYFALAIIGVLTSVVSVYFYLRIVVLMYMSDDVAVDPAPVVPRSAMAGLALATAAIFYLGVVPTRVIDLAVQSVQGLF